VGGEAGDQPREEGGSERHPSLLIQSGGVALQA
jgi:hypothetical protein